jgi:chorismate mutase
MKDIENRIGIEPIEELLAKRQQLVEQVAGLRAVHGPYGTFDPQRKSTLSIIRMKIRAQRLRDKVKVTEAQLDEEAHADPDYLAFVAQATTDRTQMGKLEGEIEVIDATIHRGNTAARYCAAEARL